MPSPPRSPASSPDGLEVMHFADADEFDDWLEDNHADLDGIWLQIAKAKSDHRSVNWAAAVPVAICHGWIDGQARRVDDDWYIQRFTPRRSKSNWSQVNVAHVERLTAEGKMRPWGLEKVEEAKSDGRWENAYQPVSSREVPEVLQQALDASPEAAAAFADLDARNRSAMVHRIQTVKRQETKERHAARFVQMLERGERLVE